MPNPYFLLRETCPGCASRNQITLFSSPFAEAPLREYLRAFYARGENIQFEYLQGANYTVVECEDCGLVFQKEVGDDPIMKMLYEEWIDASKIHDPAGQENQFEYARQYAQEIMLLINYFGGLSSNLKFFDFGMGWGRWCMMAKAFGCQSYGAELSPSRIEYARANGIQVLTWEEIPQFQFDVINTEQVFEHLPQPLETLRHLKKSLKPGGLLKISVPDGSHIKESLKRRDWSAPKGTRYSLNPIHPLEHINCYHARSLKALAQSAGLKPVKLPLQFQYQSLTNWRPFRPLLRNLIKPLYRTFFPQKTYWFFTPE